MVTLPGRALFQRERAASRPVWDWEKRATTAVFFLRTLISLLHEQVSHGSGTDGGIDNETCRLRFKSRQRVHVVGQPTFLTG